jgi:putative spermidine/putrescine transport system ATP-binding protein
VLVQFVNVSKTYDGEGLAVSGLNLDVAKGEFMTFLGPSGSGKTTSLMMLAGFETPTRGEILISGRSVSHVAPHKRNLGMVFQNYALFPHMTVAENIEFPLSVRGMSVSDSRERVARALDLVRLTKLSGRRPSELSGGQQQRVALARALVFDPLLILMDEPLGALDRHLREQMQIEIKRIHVELGVTIVYVTHDQSEALTMSDRIAVFNEGAIQQVASPSELYNKPATPFVASFIGNNNFIDCTVTTSSGQRQVMTTKAGQQLSVPSDHGLHTGASVIVSIRPEHIALGADADNCEHVLDGVLDRWTYYGDHVQACVRLSSGESITTKVAAFDQFSHLSPGDSVKVGWRADRCRAFARDSVPQAN